MNYPLMKLNKYDQDILTPQNTYYSEEYCARICDLYLTDQLHRNEKGNMQKYYRPGIGTGRAAFRGSDGYLQQRSDTAAADDGI